MTKGDNWRIEGETIDQRRNWTLLNRSDPLKDERTYGSHWRNGEIRDGGPTTNDVHPDRLKLATIEP